jgi:hypothetical protein
MDKQWNQNIDDMILSDTWLDEAQIIHLRRIDVVRNVNVQNINSILLELS